MNSSGIKRGLAGSAITALAISGLPFLASSASAVPVSANYGDNAIELFAPETAPSSISDKQDGTNTSASLVVGGGKNVTSVQFQYEVASAVGTWVDVPGGLVCTNGVFAAEFSDIPANLTRLRAVPSTGLGVEAWTRLRPTSPRPLPRRSSSAPRVRSACSRAPTSTAPGTDGQYVGVRGTASANTTAINVEELSQGFGPATATVDAPAAGANSTTFDAVLDIEGYDYDGCLGQRDRAERSDREY